MTDENWLKQHEREAWAKLPAYLDKLGFVPDHAAPHRARAYLGPHELDRTEPPRVLELCEQPVPVALSTATGQSLALPDHVIRLTRVDFKVGGKQRYVYSETPPTIAALTAYFNPSKPT